MNINEYMQWTKTTAIYSSSESRYTPVHDLMYLGLGLVGEAGEVADKIKKLYRDHNLSDKRGMAWREGVAKEIGDVFWYLARLCDELDIDPETVLQSNVNKLLSRRDRGVIGGSGDER